MLSATVSVSVQARQSRYADFERAVSSINDALGVLFTDGLGAGQIDLIWKDERTIAASSNENIDLAGSLTDIFGQACTFARVKAILVFADSANTNNVRVTRPASNGLPFMLAGGDGFDIRPGGAAVPLFCFDSTGVVVTGGSADLINIANSAGSTSVTYRIVVLGCSA